MDELGFLAGDLPILGLAYVGVATKGEQPTQYIRDMERTIKAGVVLALCREVPAGEPQ